MEKKNLCSGPMRSAHFYMCSALHSAFRRRLLEAFPVSKLGVWYLVGKILESNFQPKWNLSFLSSFTLSKIKSPNTTSCRCINSPEATVFLTFLQNHYTCVKSEGGFSSLACFWQTPLSFFQNSSFIALKHHLSETYPDVWNKGFCRNEAKWRG